MKPRSVKPTRLSNGRQCISASVQQLADSVKEITVLCASVLSGRAWSIGSSLVQKGRLIAEWTSLVLKTSKLRYAFTSACCFRRPEVTVSSSRLQGKCCKHTFEHLNQGRAGYRLTAKCIVLWVCRSQHPYFLTRAIAQLVCFRSLPMPAQPTEQILHHARCELGLFR